MDKVTQGQLWQSLRDTAAFNFQKDQSTIDRKVNVLNAALQNEGFMTSTDPATVGKRNRLFKMLEDIEYGVFSDGSSSSKAVGNPVNDGSGDYNPGSG